MKIGITTSVIQRGQTGIGQYVLSLARAFNHYRDRHHFTFFVLEEDMPLFSFAGDGMELVPVPERFRPPEKDMLWHHWHLPDLARKHHLDVIHVPTYRRLFWRHPCATVATIHDLAPFQMAGKYDWKRTLYARFIVPFLARRQDQIIAVSEHTAREISDFLGVPDQSLNIVRNGVDHDRFFPGSRDQAKSEVAERFGVRDSFFLYVARLEHPAKNHLRLIQAFEQFRGQSPSAWQLVLAGSDWNGAEAIHAAVRRSLFEKEIHCLGFVPDEHISVLMRAADIFVHPSLYEGFGIPPIEAMACGCPVICSNAGALPEVVGDSAMTLDPEDVVSWRNQMARLAGDAEMQNAWGQAGCTRAKEFDWNRTAAATLKVYNRAVEKASHHDVTPVVEDLLAR
jgi:glycosyltransferase involved in cell wall biosynthesis